MESWVIPPAQEGQRLDRALAELFPHTGLRGRRRLLKSAEWLLNGQPASTSSRVHGGDLLEIPAQPSEQAPQKCCLLTVQAPYCFFYKGAGLHSVKLAGGCAPSLEGALKQLLPEALQSQDPQLLQRLDFGTSGILAAALNPAAAEFYRLMEKSGQVKKYYLTLLTGRLEKEQKISNALDTAQRRKTKVLNLESEKITYFRPLKIWEEGANSPFAEFTCGAGPLTLAACLLSSGQRHQIRAHAAYLGHPLWGDALYGNGKGDFLLQHFALKFPGHEIKLEGALALQTRLDPQTQKLLHNWLASASFY